MRTAVCTALRAAIGQANAAMRAWWLAFMLGALLMPAAHGQALPSKRVALVIGNAAYADSPLRNPVNDATDLATKLRTLGFEVTVLTDRSRSQMTQAIREFGLRAYGAEAALFYFAGHGVQVRGRNFLLPIGQRFADEAEVENDAVDVGNVLSGIEEAGPRVALLVLDACRNAPLQRRTRSGGRGLARMDAPSGALIAFAAQPGAEAQDGSGRNGTLTKHLLAHIGTPGLAIEQLFKRVRTAVEEETQRAQSPREESSLKADFFFAGAGHTQPMPATPGALPSINFEDLERQQRAREQWAQWQTRMRTDFDRTAAFAGSADLQANAWQRFLDAWKEENPNSEDDGQLRQQAVERLAQAQRQARAPAVARPAASPTTLAAPLSVWPLRPITLVVPFSAGGPTDKVARDFAEAVRKQLNSATVVVENLGGAGGTLGASKVAKSAPDGYTFLLHHIGMATGPGLYRNLAYRPMEDFVFVGLVSEIPLTLIGRPTLPASNFQELQRWLASNRGRINFANSGLGSPSHLCLLLIETALPMGASSIPYKGTAPAMTDLLGGQTDLMCDQTSNTLGQIEAGKVKAFAVTTRQRLDTPALSRLPTLEESGLRGGANMTVWHGLYAPRGTPGPVLAAMNQALVAALRDPTFVRSTQALGAQVITDDRTSPGGHRRFVDQELARWLPLIRASGQFAD